jgi:hypothetical protein
LYVLLFILLILSKEIRGRCPNSSSPFHAASRQNESGLSRNCLRTVRFTYGPTAMSPVTVTVQPASPAFEVNNGVVVKATRESQ